MMDFSDLTVNETIDILVLLTFLEVACTALYFLIYLCVLWSVLWSYHCKTQSLISSWKTSYESNLDGVDWHTYVIFYKLLKVSALKLHAFHLLVFCLSRKEKAKNTINSLQRLGLYILLFLFFLLGVSDMLLLAIFHQALTWAEILSTIQKWTKLPLLMHTWRCHLYPMTTRDTSFQEVFKPNKDQNRSKSKLWTALWGRYL